MVDDDRPRGVLVLKVVQRPKAVAEVPLQELEMSDVEDLAGQHGEEEVPAAADLRRRLDVPARIAGVGPGFELSHILHQAGVLLGRGEGGDRKSAVEGKRESSREDPGGPRYI